MPITLTIRDETAAGKVYHELPLELPTERITVRDLIRGRVYQEVQDFNRLRGEQNFHGLVQPSGAESVRNGPGHKYRLQQHRELDWNQQFESALEAYMRNGFLILVDHAQTESLDQEFIVSSQSQVSFVKLTLLVGG